MSESKENWYVKDFLYFFPRKQKQKQPSISLLLPRTLLSFDQPLLHNLSDSPSGTGYDILTY